MHSLYNAHTNNWPGDLFFSITAQLEKNQDRFDVCSGDIRRFELPFMLEEKVKAFTTNFLFMPKNLRTVKSTPMQIYRFLPKHSAKPASQDNAR